MKNIILIILTFCFYYSYSQEFEVTPQGLKDKENPENNFIVLKVSNKTASELYNESIKYINEKYKNPDKVIKGKTLNEYLRFETFEPELLVYNNSGAKINIEAQYYTELRFKDGKIRLEILSLDMKAKDYKYKLLFSGSIFKGYVIYKKNGKLFKKETKEDLEKYFRLHISNYLNFLTNKTKDDW